MSNISKHIKVPNMPLEQNDARVTRASPHKSIDSNFNLGFYASHNAGLAISKDNEILEVVELERFSNIKNDSCCFTDQNIGWQLTRLNEILKYFSNKYGVKLYNTVYWNSIGYNGDWLCEMPDIIKNIFPSHNFKTFSHHTAHANCAFYQSPFENALIISFDGGGDDGVFNVFFGTKGKPLLHVYNGNRNLCTAYSMSGQFISEIKQEQNIIDALLTHPGKIMGLAGHGRVNLDLKSKLINYFNDIKKDSYDLSVIYQFFCNYTKISADTQISIPKSANLAATIQEVFEDVFYNEISGFLNASHNLPVVLTGGGALNIINNARLENQFQVFVPPNPSDCGLAVGLLCSALMPKNQLDCTYLGPEVWDKETFNTVVNDRNGKLLDINELANNIIEGKIYGIVQGRSEHGPRALGNRSILCSGVYPGIKDKLNKNVKGRETFRPFSPVVRLEDVNKFFDRTLESRHMAFNAKVTYKYKDKLSEVSNADNTARVQTVTREQNTFLYDLLTLLDKKTSYGILLNTSFNVDSKPILNTYKDALHVLDTKELDGVIFENYLIEK